MSKELKEITIFAEKNQDLNKGALYDDIGGMPLGGHHDGEPMVIEFGESPQVSPDPLLELVEFDESMPSDSIEFSEGDGDIESFLDGVVETAEEFEEVGDIAEEIQEMLPGLNRPMPKQEDEAKDTDYVNDGDIAKFMDCVSEVYPSQIPSHDGTTMLGCEKAVSFLDRLNSEISRAIREDSEDVLDVSELEHVRVSIMKDTLVLKDHLNSLKKKFKEMHKNSSDLGSVDAESKVPDWVSADGSKMSYRDLKKKASTPNKMVIAVPPFERALAGILINAQVSGGNSMEDVFEILKSKYDLQPREELAVMQVVMDMGFHVFRDRGTFSLNDDSLDTDDGGNPKNYGVEFIRNYFA